MPSPLVIGVLIVTVIVMVIAISIPRRPSPVASAPPPPYVGDCKRNDTEMDGLYMPELKPRTYAGRAVPVQVSGDTCDVLFKLYNQGGMEIMGTDRRRFTLSPGDNVSMGGPDSGVSISAPTILGLQTTLPIDVPDYAKISDFSSYYTNYLGQSWDGTPDNTTTGVSLGDCQRDCLKSGCIGINYNPGTSTCGRIYTGPYTSKLLLMHTPGTDFYRAVPTKRVA